MGRMWLWSLGFCLVARATFALFLGTSQDRSGSQTHGAAADPTMGVRNQLQFPFQTINKTRELIEWAVFLADSRLFFPSKFDDGM